MMTTSNDITLNSRASRIRFFFTDIDGTLTDGVTYYSEKGEELKRFSHIDGTGFHILRNLSIQPGVITGENSNIVRRRMEKLGIEHYFLGKSDKLSVLQRFSEKLNIGLSEIAYIGDDLNDLLLMRSVGISFATADAHPLCRQSATAVLSRSGGNGAFREAVELLTKWRNEDLWEVFKRGVL